MPLIKDRITPRRDGIQYGRPVAAAKVVFVGAMVGLSGTGFLTPAAADNTLVIDGIAVQSADNTAGADGDLTVFVDKRPHRLNNSADADLVTAAQIGDDCYAVDDLTVAKTNGGGARPVAGKIVDVDADGVWIKFY